MQEKPGYIELQRQGIMKERIRQLKSALSSCDLCPRKCFANRLSGESGVCKTAEYAMVSSYNTHFGEESVLIGNHGSGTIFFTNCNLLCNFCQNYDISHMGQGVEVTAVQLSSIMLELQNAGCHNINFVSPSHVVVQILEALELAIPNGLSIPLVYNTGGYDKAETIRMLEGIIDIYMPDIKFSDPEVAESYCDASDYFEVVKEAVSEMHRQCGDLYIQNGLAIKGLLVRHLVMPDDLSGTGTITEFLANEISKDTFINIMAQYRPAGKARSLVSLNRRIGQLEYTSAIEIARKSGLWRFAD